MNFNIEKFGSRNTYQCILISFPFVKKIVVFFLVYTFQYLSQKLCEWFKYFYPLELKSILSAVSFEKFYFVQKKIILCDLQKTEQN